MRMSDEEYFRSCVAKERHLAHLLGHHNIEEFYESAGTLWEGNKALPKWTRDWKACGPLLAEYELALIFPKDAPHERSTTVQIGNIVVAYADHPSKDRAVMVAIVKAVIFHLEHLKNHKSSLA
ncbi:aminoacyl-tRNA synthetase [Janthinobacterium sp. 17J80-10]|uniref:aminoacyl-tRNA synthetase n=1 Tax=Janthinobacterium sp. 17J80-10 TaxID=2497863 RepID=UPI0010056F9B|nr:aminoacyl-tRNA synthetase [Janthinobacterium sp. 17J80-10]QAU33161.1 aminoacyl-tRNA synthetase [Janthinobacterium sp. 17J80-10]